MKSLSHDEIRNLWILARNDAREEQDPRKADYLRGVRDGINQVWELFHESNSQTQDYIDQL